MPYQSRAEREAASYMTWSQLLKHVRDAEQCEKKEARRQIGNSVMDGVLFVRWAGERKNVFNSGPIQLPADDPPRDAQYWQECKTRRDLVLEPPPYDREWVNKRTAARLDKTRRFRKPLFRRDQVLIRWQLVPASRPSDATVVSLVSRRRGPKPKFLNRVKEEMRRELRSAALTKEELGELTEEGLKVRYQASRDTCRKAKREVLSESTFVDNSPDGNSDK